MAQFPFSLEKMPLEGALFDMSKLNYFAKEVFAATSVDTILQDLKVFTETYDKDFKKQEYKRLDENIVILYALNKYDRKVNILNSKNYKTIKTQGRERCILVRYLTALGYDNDYIKKVLNSIPIYGGEYLSEKDRDLIFNKIINKANNYEFITNIKVSIYKSEMDIITSIDNEAAKRLLFVYLVYYKWACNINYLKFYSKKNEIDMVLENNNDLWKVAGIMKLRVADRYKLCNQLFNLGLFKIENFKTHNYIYIPFARNKGELAFEITNYKNILGELFIYEDEKSYKRCAICNSVIKKTRSPKKYCSECAYKENLRKTKENKKSLKTQNV